MPKIAAPTVAQHRAMVQRRLVDAAEEIMRSGEPEKLTAGVVTAAAGIARNSIYRYVDSVDDLRGLVLERYLPAWLDAVEAELEPLEDPAERIVTWVAANIRQAAATGHGWLMTLSTGITPSPATRRVMDQAHHVMREALSQAWGALVLDHARSRIAAALTRGVLESSFRQLDAGVDVDLVLEVAEQATTGLVAGIVGTRR
ncbi:TetR/AcrR family transcriptional regulator [Arachnia propionica]|uniref:TetR/AcrR family transcriptional regulator n=1 Tax=Arachnia propionica TaxID=1750 RepID=A0A3P1T5C1_9ACTN|nr:TetR/AcrR family transcriptional regulator [Arachnia propionica]MDO5083362.1 TetR/AcrR family transcriptional regulator [Arachnia propionica]RRD04707.1 TetR/AcrR family transcriptional regulator [Arachnia propionica]